MSEHRLLTGHRFPSITHAEHRLARNVEAPKPPEQQKEKSTQQTFREFFDVLRDLGRNLLQILFGRRSQVPNQLGRMREGGINLLSRLRGRQAFNQLAPRLNPQAFGQIVQNQIDYRMPPGYMPMRRIARMLGNGNPNSRGRYLPADENGYREYVFEKRDPRTGEWFVADSYDPQRSLGKVWRTTGVTSEWNGKPTRLVENTTTGVWSGVDRNGFIANSVAIQEQNSYASTQGERRDPAWKRIRGELTGQRIPAPTELYSSEPNFQRALAHANRLEGNGTFAATGIPGYERINDSRGMSEDQFFRRQVSELGQALRLREITWNPETGADIA